MENLSWRHLLATLASRCNARWIWPLPYHPLPHIQMNRREYCLWFADYDVMHVIGWGALWRKRASTSTRIYNPKMTLGKNTAENDSGPVQSITRPPNFLVSRRTQIEVPKPLEHGQARLEWLGKAIQNESWDYFISLHFKKAEGLKMSRTVIAV